MFLREEERRSRTRDTDGTPGIVVITPGKERYFFPGATDELGMALARRALPDVIADPKTQIEFGEAFGAAWVLSRVIQSADKPHKRRVSNAPNSQ